MKKFLLYLLLLSPLALLAQDQPTFNIKGKLGNMNPPARAYLVYQLGANRVIDSAVITGGNFAFTGPIINPINAFIVIDRNGSGFTHLDSTADVLSFYIDKGTVELNSPDSISKAKITGSKINDDNIKLMAQLKPLFTRAAQLKAEQEAASPATQNSAAFQNNMQTQYKQLQAEQKALLKIFILNNPNSYLSLLALSSVGGPSPVPAEMDSLYNSLSPELKATETAKVFMHALDAVRSTSIGAVAPDFTQADTAGTPVTLSKLRGKYVLVDFWASWCGPCRQENPNVVRAYNKYKDKNFTIVGVSLDRENGRASWLAAIKHDGLSWTEVSDLKFWQNDAAVSYHVQSIPANFLLDPQGKIIARDLRGSDLEDKLAEVLGK